MSGEWQTIDSAPKDGTTILVCCVTDADGQPLAADVVQSVFMQATSWWGGDSGWMIYCSLIKEPELHFEPTHWMPLPEPPK